MLAEGELILVYPRPVRFVLPLVIAVLSGLGLSQSWPLVVCAEADNLPYSQRGGGGFENQIAEQLAEELGAHVEYLWIESPFSTNQRVLLEQGDCDLILAAADGQHGFETTLAYYRASYVFVQRADTEVRVETLDDPRLQEFRIGVLVPDGGGLAPPAQALVHRGLVRNQVTFVASRLSLGPATALVDAVQDGSVDVGIGWGPLLGYLVSSSGRSSVLSLSTVEPQFDVNFTPMVIPISVALRSGEIEFRDLISAAIVARWDEIQRILDEFGIPREPLPRPQPGGL